MAFGVYRNHDTHARQSETHTFAGLPVCDRFALVAIVPFFTVMTISTLGVVATMEADRTTFVTGHPVYLQVEPAFAGMQVAVASCKTRAYN